MFTKDSTSVARAEALPILHISEGGEKELLAIPPPPHLGYMSGKKVKLWRELIELGILDAYGRPTPKYASFILPSLNAEEIKLIKDELFNGFPVNLGHGISLDYSMKLFLKYCLDRIPQLGNLRVTGIHVIGSYPIDLLLKKTKYIERLFTELGIAHLYDPTLFEVKEHSDIDVRIFVESREPTGCCKNQGQKVYTYFISPRDLLNIRADVMREIAQRYADSSGSLEPVESLSVDVERYAFDDLCFVPSFPNLFHLFAFRDSSVDCLVVGNLARKSVFTAEDLYLPIEDLVSGKEESCIPQSYRGTPLETLVHLLLGFTQADFPEGIDKKGWPRFISNSVFGNMSAQLPSEEKTLLLEEQLYETMRAHWIPDMQNPEKFAEEMKLWIAKHHKNDPLAQGFFILNAAFRLLDRLPREQVEKMVRDRLAYVRISETQSTFRQIFDPILKEHIPLKALEDFLQILAFFVECSQSKTGQSWEVATTSENFEKPVFHIQYGRHTIELPGFPITDAFERFSGYFDRQVHNSQLIESGLLDLFFLLCPPSNTIEIDEERANALGVPNESLLQTINVFSNSPSLLVKYIGFLFQVGQKNQSLHSKQRQAEKFVLPLLTASRNPLLKEQLESFVGVGSIPPLDAENFEEAWIATLLEPGRGSEEIGFELWKEAFERGYLIPFSRELFIKNAVASPSLALRLFTYLMTNQKLSPTEGLSFILSCAQKVTFRRELSFEHCYFLEEVSRYLVAFLNDPTVKNPKNDNQNFANNLKAYVRWHKRNGNYATALALVEAGKNHGCFENPEITFSIFFAQALKEKDFAHAKKLLLEACEKKLFPYGNTFLYLIRYFKTFRYLAEDAELHILFISFFRLITKYEQEKIKRGCEAIEIFLDDAAISPKLKIALIRIVEQYPEQRTKKLSEHLAVHEAQKPKPQKNIPQGKKAPKETEQVTEENVKQLFDKGKESQGLTVWKELVKDTRTLAFSLRLIKEYAQKRPSLALQLFRFPTFQDQLQPSNALELTVFCARLVKSLPSYTKEQGQLLLEMSKKLSGMLESCPPEKIKKCTKSLLWLGEWLRPRDQVLASFILGGIKEHLEESPRREPIQTTLALHLKADDLHSAAALIQEGIDNNLFTEEEELNALISYFECDKTAPEPELAARLLSCMEQASSNVMAERLSLIISGWLLEPAVSLETKFSLIEVCSAWPTAVKEDFSHRVQAFCSALAEGMDEKTCCHLADFLLKTSFFAQTETRHNIENLLSMIVHKMMDLSYSEIELADFDRITQLFEKYPDCLRSMRPYVWSNIVSLLKSVAPLKLFDFYALMDAHEYLTYQSDPEAYRCIYITLTEALLDSKDERILTLLREEGKRNGVLQGASNVAKLNVTSHIFYGSCLFSKKDPSLLPYLANAYSSFNKYLDEFDREDEINKKEAFATKNTVDVAYIKVLLAAGKKVHVGEAKSIVQSIVAADFPKEYWSLAGLIANLFCKESFLPELDLLFTKLHIAPPSGINFASAISLLMKHPNAMRLKHAVHLWAMYINDSGLDEEKWKQGSQLLKRAQDENNPIVDDKVLLAISILGQCSLAIFQKRGHSGPTRVTEIILTSLQRIKDAQDLDVVLPQYDRLISTYKTLITNDNVAGVLDALPGAVINLAHFDQERFKLGALAYRTWVLLGSKKYKSQKDIDNSIVQRFVPFIENLLAGISVEKQESPLLLEQANMTLGLIKGILTKYKKTAEINRLEALCSQAVVKLNPTSKEV